MLEGVKVLISGCAAANREVKGIAGGRQREVFGGDSYFAGYGVELDERALFLFIPEWQKARPDPILCTLFEKQGFR